MVAAAVDLGDALGVVRRLIGSGGVTGGASAQRREKVALAAALATHASNRDLRHPSAAELAWCVGTLKLDPRQVEVAGMLQGSVDCLSRRQSSSTVAAAAYPGYASKTFVGVARSGLHWHEIALTLGPALVECLPAAVPGMNAQSLSNVVWALGTLQVPWDSLESSGVWGALMERLASPDIGSTLNEQGLSNVLWGLARTGAQWSTLPGSTREALEVAVARLCLRMSSQGMGLTVYSLGKLGVSRSRGTLSQTLEVAVELSIRQNGSDMAPADLIQCLCGMGRMGFLWDRLSGLSRDVLAYAVYRQGVVWASTAAPGCAAVGTTVAAVLSALSSMQCSWSEGLPPAARGALLVGLGALVDEDDDSGSSSFSGTGAGGGVLSRRSSARRAMLVEYMPSDVEPPRRPGAATSSTPSATASTGDSKAVEEELDRLLSTSSLLPPLPLPPPLPSSPLPLPLPPGEGDDWSEGVCLQTAAAVAVDGSGDEEEAETWVGREEGEGVDLHTVSASVTALATMGVTLGQLPPGISRGLLKRMAQACREAAADDAGGGGPALARLLYGTASLVGRGRARARKVGAAQTTTTTLPRALVTQLQEAFVSMSILELDAHSAALATFGVLTLAPTDFESLPLAVRRKVESLAALFLYWPTMHPRGLGLVVQGFSNVGATWEALEAAPTVARVLVQYVDAWTAECCAGYGQGSEDSGSALSVLANLGRLGEWPSLAARADDRYSDRYSDRCGGSDNGSDNGSGIGISIGIDVPAVASALFRLAVPPPSPRQHTSVVGYAVGGSGSGGGRVEGRFYAASLDSDARPSLSWTDLAAALAGLGSGLPRQWCNLSSEAREVATSSIAALGRSPTGDVGSHVGSVMYSLGRLGCPWASFVPAVQSALVCSITAAAEAGALDSRALGHVLIGLREMGTDAPTAAAALEEGLFSRFLEALFSAVRATLNDAPVMGLVAASRGFASMGVTAGGGLPRDIVRALLRMTLVNIDTYHPSSGSGSGREGRASLSASLSRGGVTFSAGDVVGVLVALGRLCGTSTSASISTAFGSGEVGNGGGGGWTGALKTDTELLALWLRVRVALWELLCGLEGAAPASGISYGGARLARVLADSGARWGDLSVRARSALVGGATLAAQRPGKEGRRAAAVAVRGFERLGATAATLAPYGGDRWATSVLVAWAENGAGAGVGGEGRRRRDGTRARGLSADAYLMQLEQAAAAASAPSTGDATPSTSASASATSSPDSISAVVVLLVQLGYHKRCGPRLWAPVVVDLVETALVECWDRDGGRVHSHCWVLVAVHQGQRAYCSAQRDGGDSDGGGSGMSMWDRDTRRTLALVVTAHLERLRALPAPLKTDARLARGVRCAFAALLASGGGGLGDVWWSDLPTRPRNALCLSLGLLLTQDTQPHPGGGVAAQCPYSLAAQVAARGLIAMSATYRAMPRELRSALDTSLETQPGSSAIFAQLQRDRDRDGGSGGASDP